MKIIHLFVFYFVISIAVQINSDLVWAESLKNNTAIKIGAILHLTGDLAMSNVAFHEGIEVAIDELNQKREQGQKLQLILEDGQNNPRMSNSAAHKLLDMHKVSALLIASYLDAMASGPLLEKAHVPAITLWDSNPEIDDAGEYIFAIGPWTPSAGEEAARYAHEVLGLKKAVVVYNTDSWSESVAKSFKDKFLELNGKIINTIILNPSEVDLRSVIAKINSYGVDMIYSPLVFNLVPFYTQIKQLQFGGKVVTSDIIVDEHISKAPDAFEGIYQTGLENPDSAVYKNLEKLYKEKYQKDISLPWFVAVGYDSMQLLGKAISIAGNNSERIKEELYKIQNYSGASTTISINQNGSSPQYEKMYQIKQSKFVPVWR